MMNTVGTRAAAAMCGSSMTELFGRLAAGWDPFEQLSA
jgi:hypothetical protein